jgi:peptide/nickel transport system substrate-binding protein
VPKRQTERFLATILFTDIVGSTEVAAELGDGGWRELVQEHHRLIREGLRKHGGREMDTAGDGFFAVFDAPAAAAACALEAIDAVAGLGIQIRAGIHVGEVEEIGPKVGGIAVSTTARIMSAAGPSQLAASSTVRDLAAGAGLQFADLGERELKGVPGLWRLYSVTRIGSKGADPGAAGDEAASRRAAAVRRSRSRPFWQRHPRATVALSAALAIVIVVSGAVVWSPWRPRALAGVAEDSVGVIDPQRNEIVAATPVGHQPSAIAVGEGSVWVANQGANTVSRLDPETHAVVDTIDVGQEPKGIALGAGSVWVTNSGAGSVTRINVATGRVVDTIPVGNGPTAVAFGAGAVWVANTPDASVTRIDPESGTPTATYGVGSLPWAIAVDDSGVWVASQDGATVSHLDPATGTLVAAPIVVGSRPSAIAIAGGSVWVANSGDGSISHIDPARENVKGVIDVGGAPVGLATDGSTLWVADSAGAVERLSIDRPTDPPAHIATQSAAVALAVVGGELWFASGASAASHRGGALRIVSQDIPTPDPNGSGGPGLELASLIYDGLVGYRHIGGIAGTQQVADLATAIPTPSDGGLTYTFKLRSGIVYSDGTPLKASHFVFGIERAFQVRDPTFGNIGGNFLGGIEGADTCMPAPVERCDLSAGVVADDAAGTVTIHLSKPDPDFLYKLGLPFSTPLVPGTVPDNELASEPFPTLGPYRLASASATELRFDRNPIFQSWDPQIRPDGFATEVVWTGGVDPDQQVAMVESGQADYMFQQIPAAAFDRLETQFTAQLHLAPASVTYFFMNTQKAPFDDADVRRAVNMAIDRDAMVELRGGPEVVVPTCQVLPPNFPGYQPYCPYTVDPAPDGRGRWLGPDLDEARRLIADSGLAHTPIVVGPTSPRLIPLGHYMVGLLKRMGFSRVTEHVETDPEDVFSAIFAPPGIQMGAFEVIQDYPGPDTYFAGVTCDKADGLTNYCNPALDEAVANARALQLTDPPAAVQAWAAVDRMVTDLALFVPVVNEGSDFVSARVGNYQSSLPYGVLLDQLWVQ